MHTQSIYLVNFLHIQNLTNTILQSWSETSYCVCIGRCRWSIISV